MFKKNDTITVIRITGYNYAFPEMSYLEVKEIIDYLKTLGLCSKLTDTISLLSFKAKVYSVVPAPMLEYVDPFTVDELCLVKEDDRGPNNYVARVSFSLFQQIMDYIDGQVTKNA